MVKLMREYWLVVIVGVVGVGILGYGLWQVVVPERVTVEIARGDKSSEHLPVSAQGSELGEGMLVDVAGAVANPGVYTLPAGSRVGEALLAAGGLAAGADRAWVAATLNLASPITDGQKIYIPENSENQKTQITGVSEVSDNQMSAKVNINTASESELDTLWGVGTARATAIVAGRPYATVEELLTKGVVPQNVYDRIKNEITVY